MSNNIVEEMGGFYYWGDNDELIGPFETEQQCEVAYCAALRWVAKDHQPKIRKMKDNMGL